MGKYLILSILVTINMTFICLANVIKCIKPKEREQKMHVLPPLPYPYNELEPYIDARTVEIHYTKHHQTYVDNLNKALADYPELQAMSLETLLVSLDKIPVVIREAVRNNGGGHFAHSLFWKIMCKQEQTEPAGELAKAIEQDFGSFDNFKEAFTKTCRSFFASGWVWLCVDKMKKLVIVSTSGHDVPMQQGYDPIMVFDVWEHAYYLKYQNRRPEYIDNWWKVVNWDQVAQNLATIKDRK
jgi:Fe-Mn family superoxide dismutase